MAPIGQSGWTTKQVAEACGICVTRATAKYSSWEARLSELLRALQAADGRRRPCDMAEMILAVLETGGRLVAADRDKLRQRITELARRPSWQRSY